MIRHDLNTIIGFRKPGAFQDEFTLLLRAGVRKPLAQAVQAGRKEFLPRLQGRMNSRGLRVGARNGYLPERRIQTGVGAVPIKVAKVRDRRGPGIQFHSRWLQPYLRRTKSLGELIRWRYRKGLSAGGFQDALARFAGAAGERELTRERQPPEGPVDAAAWALVKALTAAQELRLPMGRRDTLPHPSRGGQARVFLETWFKYAEIEPDNPLSL